MSFSRRSGSYVIHRNPRASARMRMGCSSEYVIGTRPCYGNFPIKYLSEYEYEATLTR